MHSLVQGQKPAAGMQAISYYSHHNPLQATYTTRIRAAARPPACQENKTSSSQASIKGVIHAQK